MISRAGVGMKWQEVLATSRRVAVLDRLPSTARVSALELSLLVTMGIVAACANGLLRLRLGIPGHAIVLIAIPYVLGLSCVPRRFSGHVMGASGLAAGGVLRLLIPGVRLGTGALTALAVTGVCLDLATRHAKGGRSLVVRCALAGVAGSVASLFARAVTKGLLMSPVDALKPLGLWWLKAIVTYPLCGAVAGLVAAALVFRVTPGTRGEHSGSDQP